MVASCCQCACVFAAFRAGTQDACGQYNEVNLPPHLMRLRNQPHGLGLHTTEQAQQESTRGTASAQQAAGVVWCPRLTCLCCCLSTAVRGVLAGVGDAVPWGLGILMVTWAGSLAGMSMVTCEGVGWRGVRGGLGGRVASAGAAGVHRKRSSRCAISCKAVCLQHTKHTSAGACVYTSSAALVPGSRWWQVRNLCK